MIILGTKNVFHFLIISAHNSIKSETHSLDIRVVTKYILYKIVEFQTGI